MGDQKHRPDQTLTDAHTAAEETPTSAMTDSTTPPPPPPPTDDSASAAAENKGGEKEEKEDEGEEKGDVAMPEAPAVAQAAVAPPSATVAAVAVAAPAQTGGGKRSPSDFLKTVLGRSVVVKLNSGIDYRGELLYANRVGYFCCLSLVWGLSQGNKWLVRNDCFCWLLGCLCLTTYYHIMQCCMFTTTSSTINSYRVVLLILRVVLLLHRGGRGCSVV